MKVAQADPVRYGKSARDRRIIRNDPGVERCQRCGAPLAWETQIDGKPVAIRYRPGTRYCSGACRQAAYRQRQARRS